MILAAASAGTQKFVLYISVVLFIIAAVLFAIIKPKAILNWALLFVAAGLAAFALSFAITIA